MATYQIDVRIYGTAYITADSESEAMQIAKDMANTEPGDWEDDGPVKLSPAMTIWGVDDDSAPELVEDDEEEEVA